MTCRSYLLFGSLMRRTCSPASTRPAMQNVRECSGMRWYQMVKHTLVVLYAHNIGRRGAIEFVDLLIQDFLSISSFLPSSAPYRCLASSSLRRGGRHHILGFRRFECV